MRRLTLTRLIAAGLAAAPIAAFWLTLAPTQLGGPASYALVVGSSMEPGLHRGDLAVVHRRERPGTGDVVLYRDRELGRDILHRVVAVEGGRFVTKGDNNDFRDGYRPAAQDVRGELWLRVPALGGVLEWVREPRHAALLVGLTVVLALAAGTGAGAASRGRRRTPRPQSASSASAAPPETAFVVAGVGFAVCLVLAAVAWTRPVERVVTEPGAVQQARFDYGAAVARSAVYPDGSVDTGEPVFLRLVDRVDLRFDWSLDAPDAAGTRGTTALEAVLSDGRGWERVFPLAPATRFRGASTSAEATLDLARIRGVAERVDELTGAGVGTWALSVRPAVSAELDGRLLSFDRPLRFQLDTVRLQPDPGEERLESALAPRVEETAQRRVATALPLGLPVGWARLLALVGAAAALALAAAARSRATGRGAELSEHLHIATRHADLLVESAAPPVPFGGRVVELGDFDSLRRVAEHAGRLVVHTRTEHGHEYAVEDGGSLYRYRVGRSVEPEPWLRAAAG
jgi:signal peptidase I